METLQYQEHHLLDEAYFQKLSAHRPGTEDRTSWSFTFQRAA
ncbi:hypothetical protein FOQG_01212 [Fusarium oxysporum f. sp. raphani 54005]|uniref:Uncharacterized protein n=4 Tax=Fusarium oxysporum TaxID=5507 RepID=X0CVS6_FUSOX|nr:hypothetical protein FOVG_09054 [Fusarium oxysporum f. sp. pisi HDV247]EXK98241.1 hypothetical protein FOQG_01212 [Fusarium oxysporum f. sp. raphani 54005]EXL83887.1 hypothetical protein FOPG_03485 [Fusarium oxysporum f. sp. conglutinans race 2 54008]EXM23491.1 hypothetical protein FOTG_09333 [Fusarium oxysporum f. sp. vasinfectum 25433]